jgi:hypothetical protein
MACNYFTTIVKLARTAQLRKTSAGINHMPLLRGT